MLGRCRVQFSTAPPALSCKGRALHESCRVYRGLIDPLSPPVQRLLRSKDGPNQDFMDANAEYSSRGRAGISDIAGATCLLSLCICLEYL